MNYIKEYLKTYIKDIINRYSSTQLTREQMEQMIVKMMNNEETYRESYVNLINRIKDQYNVYYDKAFLNLIFIKTLYTKSDLVNHSQLMRLSARLNVFGTPNREYIYRKESNDKLYLGYYYGNILICNSDFCALVADPNLSSPSLENIENFIEYVNSLKNIRRLYEIPYEEYRKDIESLSNLLGNTLRKRIRKISEKIKNRYRKLFNSITITGQNRDFKDSLVEASKNIKFPCDTNDTDCYELIRLLECFSSNECKITGYPLIDLIITIKRCMENNVENQLNAFAYHIIASPYMNKEYMEYIEVDPQEYFNCLLEYFNHLLNPNRGTWHLSYQSHREYSFGEYIGNICSENKNSKIIKMP